jgi:hypothetical protein
MWCNYRAREIKDRLAVLQNRPTIRFTFTPSNETTFIDYFPDQSSELESLKTDGFDYVLPTDIGRSDVAIVTAHGADLSGALWTLRRRAPQTLFAVWLWDNHVGHVANLQTAFAADLVFPSHGYQLAYLVNPASVLALHVPSCCAQWTRRDAALMFQRATAERSSRIAVNYVDYTFSWRSELLRKMRAEVPEADVNLMSPDDRSRYFGRSRKERFEEWLGYKASLVLPIDRDVSTRVFDALLSGQVIVCPQNVPDFDQVISLDWQRRLGVLRIPTLDMPTIREFSRRAVAEFDNAGAEGVLTRHRYAIENHMLVNRVAMMLRFIREVAQVRHLPVFFGDQQRRFGLYLIVPETLKTG